MTLCDAEEGEDIEILSVVDRRFARASVLLGLVDGAAATVIERDRNGSALLELDGSRVHVPAMLARRVRCRSSRADGHADDRRRRVSRRESV